MKLRYCLFFQSPILHKYPITGGVWVVSGGVCLVSGMCLRWGLRRSQDVAIPNQLAKFEIGHTRISSTLCCIKTSMFGSVWMVSEGVWMMSEWCLRVSGEASIPNLLAKKYIKSWYSDIAFFFQCPVLYKNAYVLGCLNCVWECLDRFWGCLGMN